MWILQNSVRLETETSYQGSILNFDSSSFFLPVVQNVFWENEFIIHSYNLIQVIGSFLAVLTSILHTLHDDNLYVFTYNHVQSSAPDNTQLQVC